MQDSIQSAGSTHDAANLSKCVSSGIQMLPPEILLAVCAFLPAADVAAFSATCSHLRTIGTSQEVWRPRCLALWSQHAADQKAKENDATLWRPSDEEDGWWRAWYRLFGPHEQDLGFCALTNCSRGRLLRFTLDAHDVDGEPIDRFRVTASTVKVADSDPDDPERLAQIPAQALLHSSGGYYMPPAMYPGHPDADLLVDILRPSLLYQPMFTITAQEGAHMSGQSSTIKLQLQSTSQKVLKLMSKTHRGLPSQNLVVSGALRTEDGAAPVEDLLCRCISWTVAGYENGVRHERNSVRSFLSGFNIIRQSPTAGSPPGTTVQLIQQLAQDQMGLSTGESYMALHGPQSLPSKQIWHPQYDNRVLASSLGGLFCANYGPHSHEFSWLYWDGDDGYLACEKITGDANIPSGQLTWRTEADHDISYVPTTTHEELLRLTDGRDQDFQRCKSAGMVEASGHIAGHNFSNPAFTPANAIFIRSERDGQRVVDESACQIYRRSKAQRRQYAFDGSCLAMSPASAAFWRICERLATSARSSTLRET